MTQEIDKGPVFSVITSMPKFKDSRVVDSRVVDSLRPTLKPLGP